MFRTASQIIMDKHMISWLQPITVKLNLCFRVYLNICHQPMESYLAE